MKNSGYRPNSGPRKATRGKGQSEDSRGGTSRGPRSQGAYEGRANSRNKDDFGGYKGNRDSKDSRGRDDYQSSRGSRGRNEYQGNRDGRGRDEYQSSRGSRGRDEYPGNRDSRGRDEYQGSRESRDSRDSRGRDSFRGASDRKVKREFPSRFRKDEGGFSKVKRTPERRASFKKPEKIEAVNTSPKTVEETNLDREDRIEGRNSVFEAIRSGRPLNKLFVLKDSDDVLTSRIIAMAREKDIPIQYLERSKLDSISQTRTHQGVILEVAAKEYVELEDILKIAEEKGEDPFILVLDGITDTNNLGSIIRSAECAGVHGIILPKRRSATLNATVAKVAAGALEYVPVARVTNVVQSLRSLKNKGLWIIGADMDGESEYHNTNLTGPTALIIGGEGEGLSRLVKDECDTMVKIPMKGKISSLNAGVAAALIMFEIMKQRDKK